MVLPAKLTATRNLALAGVYRSTVRWCVYCRPPGHRLT
jgi:hypothetical protein